MPRVKPRWPQLYLGPGFTTLATLVLELALTRIFSVVFYYHFAFLAISVALFGLGAGGVFSYVVEARAGRLFYKLGVLACAASLSVVGLLWCVLGAARSARPDAGRGVSGQRTAILSGGRGDVARDLGRANPTCRRDSWRCCWPC